MTSPEARGRAAQARGHTAEAMVARHYAAQGYRLVASRWRNPAGELDLVMAGAQLLIFVEVKQRADHALAAAALSTRQQRRLLAGAEAFLAAHPEFQSQDCRFDVALLDQHGQIQILESALGF